MARRWTQHLAHDDIAVNGLHEWGRERANAHRPCTQPVSEVYMPRKGNPRGSGLAWLRDVIANPPDGCASWPAAKNTRGYGITRFDGKSMLTHRVSWMLAHGDIPQGLGVLHRCKQSRACCNPLHLYVGTQLDNCNDRTRDGTANPARGDKSGARLWPERRPRGEANSRAVLTSEQVLQIRERRSAGEPLLSIAMAFGVSKSLVSAIALQLIWKHL